MDYGQLAEVETARVHPALLVASREGAKLAVPGLVRLVAAVLEGFTIDGICEVEGRAILVAVDQLQTP